MKLKVILLLILTCFNFSCKTLKKNNAIKKEILKNQQYDFTSNEEYKILKVNRIKNFYILLVQNKTNDSLKLVIEKNNIQIKKAKIKKNNLIKLKTYSFYELYALGCRMEHFVKGKKVWSTDETFDLRFTGEMGNEIYLNESIDNNLIAQDEFLEIYYRIEYFFNKNYQGTMFSKDYEVMEQLTGILSDKMESHETLYFPTLKNLNDWNEWFIKNKNKLYIDEITKELKLIH